MTVPAASPGSPTQEGLHPAVTTSAWLAALPAALVAEDAAAVRELLREDGWSGAT